MHTNQPAGNTLKGDNPPPQKKPSRDGALHTSSALTQGHPSPGRSAPPCFAAESVRADTLRALPEGVASPPRKVADKQNAQRPNRDSSPHTQNTRPPHNRLECDSPPPPQFARHGAHNTLNHRESPTEPGGIPRTPEPQTRRGIDIPRRDIRVSEAKRGRVPCRSKGNIYTPSLTNLFQGERKDPADSKESAGSFKSAPPGTRTQNPLIKSQLLCQLS